MRRSHAEKIEIIHLVEHSELSISRTLDELDVPRSTFYRWYQRYQEEGLDGVADLKPRARQFWNRIPVPEPGHCECPGSAVRTREPGQVIQAASVAYHRYGRLFHLRIERLSNSEGL